MVQITLSTAQMDAIKAIGEHILIKGVPGSGKTTVLLAKLAKILEEESNASILFITYNNTLQKYITESLSININEELNKQNVEILTFHKWSKKVLLSVFAYKSPMNFKEYTRFYESSQTSDKHRFYNDTKYKDFLLDEIKWIKNKAIYSYAEYKSIKRVGRGHALQVADRKVVYDIMGEFDKYLAKKKVVLWEDYANLVNENIVKINLQHKYDYVFIDEAQDLSQSQLISLRKSTRKALIIAADLGQKIYKTDFSWKSTGINVLGGRTKSLTSAFRSTKEIMNLANSLLHHDTALTKSDIEQPYDATESGLFPAVLVADKETEYDMVAKLVKEIQTDYAEEGIEGTIGILNFANTKCEIIQYVLKTKGINAELIKDQNGSALTPGVKILTMHGAKGLEFDEVIITGINKSFPSLKWILDDEFEETINTNRRLLYVSMTRAKENVYITYKGQPSMYIEELDSNYYELEKH